MFVIAACYRKYSGSTSRWRNKDTDIKKGLSTALLINSVYEAQFTVYAFALFDAYY